MTLPHASTSGDWDNEPEVQTLPRPTDVFGRITRFNFTHAIPGGAWIETADGYRNWYSFSLLEKHNGKEWIDRHLRKQGWMTGCWVDCD